MIDVVYTEEERDGMLFAYRNAQEKHGIYESLFAVATYILRKRNLLGGVPDGFVLVPKEPTYDMAGEALEAWDKAMKEHKKKGEVGDWFLMMGLVYRAMISAAPNSDVGVEK